MEVGGGDGYIESCKYELSEDIPFIYKAGPVWSL